MGSIGNGLAGLAFYRKALMVANIAVDSIR